MGKVLLIIADDLGKDMWGVAPLPRLRALEAIGRTYKNAWMGPVCSNFRAQLELGLEPHRPGNLVGGVFPVANSDWSMDTSGPLMAKFAASSANFGKHHLCDPVASFHPNDCGWIHFDGTIGNISNYFSWTRTVNGQASHSSEYVGYSVRNGVLVEIEKSTPLIRASFHLIHQPFHEPPAELHTQTLPLDSHWKKALAMCEAFDNLAADLAIEALAHGYTVFVLSDNGTDIALGGSKGTLFERGISCPLFVVGPEVVQGESSILIQATDYHSTVLEILGNSPVSENDSISFAWDLYGASPNPRNYIKCSKWLATGQLPEVNNWSRAIRSSSWKLISIGQSEEFLYNLLDDPSESNNLLDGTLSRDAKIALNRLRFFSPQLK